MKLFYNIKKCPDKLINIYLSSRNYNFVRKFMINKIKIHPIDHYIWWFSNKRKNFILYKNNKPIIIFWYEVHKIKKNIFKVAGWWPISNLFLFDFRDVIKIHEFLHNLKIKGAWICVINKKNKFTNNINKYLGYKKMENQKLFIIAKNFFKADLKKFNYYFLLNKNV